MSASNEAALSTIQSAIFGELKKNWGWLLALGIVSIILGTIGIWMTFEHRLGACKLSAKTVSTPTPTVGEPDGRITRRFNHFH